MHRGARQEQGHNGRPDDVQQLLLPPSQRPRSLREKLVRIKITKELSAHMAISLEGIRETRNMIMHFHPEENDDGAKARLSKARDFIRKLANEIDEYD